MRDGGDAMMRDYGNQAVPQERFLVSATDGFSFMPEHRVNVPKQSHNSCLPQLRKILLRWHAVAVLSQVVIPLLMRRDMAGLGSARCAGIR